MSWQKCLRTCSGDQARWWNTVWMARSFVELKELSWRSSSITANFVTCYSIYNKQRFLTYNYFQVLWRVKIVNILLQYPVWLIRTPYYYFCVEITKMFYWSAIPKYPTFCWRETLCGAMSGNVCNNGRKENRK